MTSFQNQYEFDRHPSAWTAFYTGWWFGFDGNIQGAGRCLAYSVYMSFVNTPILGGSRCHGLNTKNIGYSDASQAELPGGSSEQFYSRDHPRLFYQGIVLSEDVVSPWVEIDSSFQTSVGIAEDGQLYAGGARLIYSLDPNYVSLPCPEVTGSSDSIVPTDTRPSAGALLPDLGSGGQSMFRLCTDTSVNTKFTYAEIAFPGSVDLFVQDDQEQCVLALSEDGKVFAAGQSRLGHFCSGTAATALSVLTQISTTTYTKLSVSDTHVLGITDDNDLHCWGNVTGIGDVYDGFPTTANSSFCGLGRTASSCVFFATKISGVVKNIEITDGGSGYSAPPSVTFSAPAETANLAIAIANVASGSVQSITLIQGGVGYTSAPTITFASPPGTGSVAQATCEIATKFNDCAAGKKCSAVIDEDGDAFQTAGYMHSLEVNLLRGGYSFCQAKTPETISMISINQRGANLSQGTPSHAFFVTATGGVYAKGINAAGQLGNGAISTGVIDTPISVLTHTGVASIAPGEIFSASVAVDLSGKLLFFGRNNNGFIREADSGVDVVEPLQIGPLTDKWIKAKANRHGFHVIRDDDASPDYDYG